MRSAVTKEKKGLSFSYLDLILLILTFLVFSLGIGLFFESENGKKSEESVTVTLEAVLPEVLRDAVPKAGDSLYGENGEKTGTVLSAVTSDEVVGFRLVVVCQTSAAPDGEEMAVETASFIRTMTVTSVEENKGENQ